MFKQRLITSLILIPFVLVLIQYAPPWCLGVLTLGVTLILAYEWLNLVPLTQFGLQAVFGLILLLLSASVYTNTLVFDAYLVVGVIGWGLILLAVLTYPRSQSIWGNPAVVLLACLLFLPLLFGSMCSIYQLHKGKNLIVYLFCLVWSVDTGAYLVGKRYGAHRLIPRVSPGKTIEGVLGGLGLLLVVACVGAWYFQPRAVACWIAMAMLAGVVSIIGDLFISMLKRRRGVKDTGALLPGHGGMLDRLDSLIAVAPFFVFGIHWCLV